jgi:hypothetical protein
VVAIRVREYDSRDIGRDVPERGEIGLEPAAEARESGVDGGQSATLFDQIPVDERITEPVDAGNDVWSRVDGPILFVAPRI